MSNDCLSLSLKLSTRSSTEVMSPDGVKVLIKFVKFAMAVSSRLRFLKTVSERTCGVKTVVLKIYSNDHKQAQGFQKSMRC